MSEHVTFDHYEVLTRRDGSLFELGRGAMGITYKAFDSNLRIPVALKVINVPDLTSVVARNRFVQEARAAAKLRHRHVASVFHLGLQGDTYFYAMEFIDGETVEALIKRRGPLPELVALQICLQVTKALAAAEQHGLVHRDIKPSNLMLVREDDELCAKVIDFGLATSRLTEEERTASTTSGFLGTPHFASPEQLEEKEFDHRSDFYSLGATLWYMLAGAPPFTGAIARVIHQHLSAEPPYEQLEGRSPETLDILRHLLAKDPADRFQKAAELRQALERASEELADGPVAAAARLAMDETRVAPPGAGDRDLGEYPTGSTIADHYEVIEPLGATNHGWQYHARDVPAQRDVRILLLALDPGEERAAFTQLERDMENLQQLEHPSVLRVFSMETIEQRVLIALQWTNGTTLLQLLRTRRKLAAVEVLRLLEMMAAGVDHAITHGLTRLDLGLHQIHVQFLTEALGMEEQLREPIDEWPPFELKINPMAITRELSQSQTWAGGQTLIGHPADGLVAAPVSPGVAHTRSLAVLVYELLGGSVSPLLAANAGAHGITRYSPLANLTEEGNEVLREALDPKGRFHTAGEFYRALAGLDQLEDRHYEKPEVMKRPETFATSAPTFSTAQALPPGETLTIAPVRPASRSAWGLVAALLIVGLGAGYYGLRNWSTETVPATPIPIAQTTEPSGIPSDPTPPEATPVPARATPVPVPDRRELLKAAKLKAEQIEEDGDPYNTIEAWMAVARAYPESEIGRLRLETVLTALRPKASQFTGEGLTRLDPLLREAAQLDVVSAMMILGDLCRETQPTDSFQWYSAAAAKGVPAAATQVGLMLSNGMGASRNLEKAVEFFELAANKGDDAAKAALGECLLYGKGIEKDVGRAIELLQQAAKHNNLRALSRLGTCYHQGVGVKQDYAEALRLFKQAADLGSAEALGNIGVLYMNGDGVPKSPQKAVEYFERGADAADAYCMYLYAVCFESGTGVTPNPDAAQRWYKKAAQAGIAKAVEWCKKNGVKY